MQYQSCTGNPWPAHACQKAHPRFQCTFSPFHQIRHRLSADLMTISESMRARIAGETVILFPHHRSGMHLFP
jgi:hypothetical protein